MNAGDIRQSADLGMDWVDISIPASDKLRQYKLREPLAVLLERLESFIGMARTLGLAVCVGCEDASRADDDTLRQIASVAQRAARCVCAMPIRSAARPVRTARYPFLREVYWSGDIEMHAHNDLGWPPPIRWRR
jgi:homocitrate synthase NifV